MPGDYVPKSKRKTRAPPPHMPEDAILLGIEWSEYAEAEGGIAKLIFEEGSVIELTEITEIVFLGDVQIARNSRIDGVSTILRFRKESKIIASYTGNAIEVRAQE